MRSINFVTNIVSPYRIDLFNDLELFKRNKKYFDDVKVFVDFMSLTEPNRSWKVDLSKLRDTSLDYFKFDNTYNFSGYGYNPIFSPVTNKSVPIEVKFDQITNPSNTVSFATAAGLFEVNKSLNLYPVSSLTTPDWNFPTFHGRFKGYGVICWADGHASTMKAKYLSKNKNYQKYFLGDIDKDGNTLTSEYFNLQ